MVTGVAGASGGVAIPLPAAVGTNPSSPPALSCYTTDNPSSGVWVAVADGWSATSTFCGLVFSGGVWNAVMVNMDVGWTAGFIVIY
jgi:hypothetical protein